MKRLMFIIFLLLVPVHMARAELIAKEVNYESGGVTLKGYIA